LFVSPRKSINNNQILLTSQEKSQFFFYRGYLVVKSYHFPAENKKNGHKGTKAQRKTFIIKILGVFVS
jgi:hypothetical protein